MTKSLSLAIFLLCSTLQAATIAIIDTGFDLDHEFLRPKILKSETDEELADPQLKRKFHGWDFHDNSHLKRPVIEDNSELEQVLRYRELRAKGHREGLTPEELEWYTQHSKDKEFMAKVKQFKKHVHGTVVAGIALREGENINIFPIRGLGISAPVVTVVEDEYWQATQSIRNKSPRDKFNQEIGDSLDRVSTKFNKICRYLNKNNIQVVNASYGITYKNISTKFRDTYKEYLGVDIDEGSLQSLVSFYFTELYRRAERTIRRYPNMLFVFSAGNSGLDNDQFHHYPSKVKLPNTISVAAVNGDFLASFSNFGKDSVDIAAPGVAIQSLLPKVYCKNGEEVTTASNGTSMAAPYISNLAAQIMNTNPKLNVMEVKSIILQTGNEKTHLKDKLVSGSVVDNHRALKAARLSKEMPLTEAINLSRLDIVPTEPLTKVIVEKRVDPVQNMMQTIPGQLTPQDDDEEEGPLTDPAE